MERFAFDLSNSLKKKVSLETITWGGSNKWLALILPYFFFRASLKLITNRGIDIIHMQDAVQAPIGWLLHIIFRKPYIVVAHGLDITYPLRVYQMLILPFVRRADAVVSISTATKNEAESRGVNAKKSHVVTLGTYDDYVRIAPNRSELERQIGRSIKKKVLLLTTGRLVRRKGVSWFIDNVLPAVVKQQPDTLYLVGGEGVERENIIATTKKAGMTRHVLLLGRVSDEVRSLLYLSCDVFVMPNIVVSGDMEGFGIVAHEAATAELAVVASNLEGIADAIKDGHNGILLKAGDKEAYARTICKLLKYKSLRQKLGRKARKYTLQEYSWNSIANQYTKVYEGIKSEHV